MSRVPGFIKGIHRLISLPQADTDEQEMVRKADCPILRPVRPGWESLRQHDKADADFLTERENII